jgi:phosphoinositide-3-kinase regulatory subunit 4
MAQVHGDLKPENIMLTSWGWLVVTDLSRIYKPTYIDEDDMSTYQFFFQTRKNASCCIAPERFR